MDHPMSGAQRPPLAVDLDGTLVTIDTLHEGLLHAVSSNPRKALLLLGSLRKSRAAFKRVVASEASFDPALLPYNESLLAYLRAEKAQGRRIGLFTAADQSIADAISDHLQIFDAARGSDGSTNLSGDRKLKAIREEFGDVFAYAGDAKVDAPLFALANACVLVGPQVARLEGMVGPTSVVEMRFATPRLGARVWTKALRLPHWTKNVLVFLSPVVGFSMLDVIIAVQSVLLFVAMGLLASATYLLNDLLDLRGDRAHAVKRGRPMAAGLVPAKTAIVMGFVLGILAFLIGLFLPSAACLSLLGYLVITLAYSFALKRIAIIDVFVLAGLFTLRVYAGSTLLPAPASPWLLTFSMFFFLGLAMTKRYAELERVVSSGGDGVVSRGYSAKDLPLVISAGVASGFGAIAIMMMYLMAEQYPSGQYERPGLLWGLIPVILIWTLRMWHRTVHGLMNEDPLMFAMHDRFSLSLGAISLTILFLAWLPA